MGASSDGIYTKHGRFVCSKGQSDCLPLMTIVSEDPGVKGCKLGGGVCVCVCDHLPCPKPFTCIK